MWSKSPRFVAVPFLLSSIVMFVFAGAMPVAAQSADREKQEEFEGSDMIRQRAEYFNRQRAYPLDRIPQGARSRALEQLRVMQEAETARPQAMGAWSELGPSRMLPAQGFAFWGSPTDSGRVTSMAVDPNDPKIVYLGAAEGGVWKSTDAGAKWTPLTDQQASLSVGSIAIDPTNSQTIYVGTGEGDFSGDAYYGAGILKSTDGGSTWTLLAGGSGGTFSVCSSGSSGLTSPFSGSYIGSIAVDPDNNQNLLAGVFYCPQYGVFRSTDGGNTWNAISALSGSAPGTSVVFVGGGVAYAALGYPYSGGDGANGVYESTDSGKTWAAANGTGTNVLPSGTSVGRILLAAAASNSQVLYAAITTGSNFVGIYSTSDGGLNWSVTNAPDFCSKQCSYNLALAVSPVDENVVYAAGIYKFSDDTPTTVIGSIDGGTTWTAVGSSTGGKEGKVHTDAHALAFAADGSRLFVGTDGGAWVTREAATPDKLNWEGLNDTLSTTQFYPGFVYDGKGNAIGGTQDNGSVVRDGTTDKWSNVTCGDGGFSAIDTTTNPYTFYTACTFSQGIDKSTNPLSPASWTAITTGINSSDPALFIPPMVMDPANPSTLYYGTNQVYKTTNGGSSWASISPQPLPGSTGNVSAIAVAPSNTKTIYAGTTDSKVVVTTAGGGSWTNVSTGLPPRYVTHVGVDPKTSTTAYVTYSGFSGFVDTKGHVFATTNGGVKWTDISGNLPNIPVNDLVVDPVIANTLYAATDLGVFSTSDGGKTWSTFGTGLPKVAVLSLTLEPSKRLLAAATHGRSAWKIDLAKK